MKHKVCFLVSAGQGGSEHITILYAKILMEKGFDCSLLICRNKDERVYVADYIPKGLTQETITSRYRYMIFPVWKFLRRENPDIVFSTIPGLSMLVLFLKRLGLYRGKVIIRDSNMPSRQAVRTQKMAKRLYRYADVLIAQTEEMKEEMVRSYGVNRGKIRVINNPTDEETIKDKMKERFPFDHKYINYVSVGRIMEQKDYLTAVRAFALVLKKQPNSRFYIVGGESPLQQNYAQSVHQEVERLGITDKVFFEGFQDNPYKYEDGCDVFVLSSIYEGLPNVMLDAMYLGKPVAVTTSIPYIDQVVHDGENGYKVKAGDYKSLAEAMLKAKDLKDLPMFVPVNNSSEQLLDLFKTLI